MKSCNSYEKPIGAMTVAYLIELLEKHPKDMLVATTMYSETRLLKAEDIEVEELCQPRIDGWIHAKRPDVPSISYLVFPGN